MNEPNLQTDGTQDGAPGGAENSGSAANTDLAEAQKKIAELTETAKRALADLQNYRKRTEEERAAFAQFANAKLILELLPVLDNFQRAFVQVPQEIASTEWFKGTLAIEQQLIGIVKKQGVEEMSNTVSQKLDPRRHEAIATGPGEPDTVIEEFEKGYMLGDKVLRPAKVKVGNGTPLTPAN